MAAMSVERGEFEAAAERHRRELHVHCYRMLGSLDEADDAVQETFLRAWRRRSTYAGRASLRAWLYKIATNTCLDALGARPRRPTPVEDAGAGGGGATEVLWLQPYPDALLEPDAALVAKETIELAFMVAIQHLTPQSRAVLILRDVLDWSARDTAELLETSTAAVNSALQRARGALAEHLPAERAEWPSAIVDPTAAERELLRRYMDATDRSDIEALKATLHEEATFAMPPQPGVWQGRDTVVDGWVSGGFGGEEFGDMRCRLTTANRQPAVACYVQKPGTDVAKLFAIDVLRFEDGAVREIVTFSGDALLGRFGIPLTL